jgi:hypothetical protein
VAIRSRLRRANGHEVGGGQTSSERPLFAQGVTAHPGFVDLAGLDVRCITVVMDWVNFWFDSGGGNSSFSRAYRVLFELPGAPPVSG